MGLFGPNWLLLLEPGLQLFATACLEHTLLPPPSAALPVPESRGTSSSLLLFPSPSGNPHRLLALGKAGGEGRGEGWHRPMSALVRPLAVSNSCPGAVGVGGGDLATQGIRQRVGGLCWATYGWSAQPPRAGKRQKGC